MLGLTSTRTLWSQGIFFILNNETFDDEVHLNLNYEVLQYAHHVCHENSETCDADCPQKCDKYSAAEITGLNAESLTSMTEETND